jgi:Asp-tRNA(Asn)/Glu-tRNA(Gln) amidotransferase A subunit family amidase
MSGTRASHVAGLICFVAVEILEAIRNKVVSAETIMKCFVLRAIKSAELFNGNAQECYAEALAAAREVDRRVERGVALRPLEGLPISVKDHFEQRGYLSTCGCASFCLDVKENDGLLIGSLVCMCVRGACTHTRV